MVSSARSESTRHRSSAGSEINSMPSTSNNAVGSEVTPKVMDTPLSTEAIVTDSGFPKAWATTAVAEEASANSAFRSSETFVLILTRGIVTL